VRRLKVMAVVRRVFGVLTDGPLMLRAAGIPFIALAITDFAEAMVAPGSSALSHIGATLMPLVSLVVQFVADAACAVKVHRALLLAEKPAPTSTTGLEWPYIKRLLWVSLVFIPGLLVFGIVVSITGSLDFIHALPARPLDSTWYSIALGAAFYILIVPPALSLPAVAIGRGAFGIRAGYAAARGNILRLFSVYLLSALLPMQGIRLVALGLQQGILWLFPATSLAATAGGAVAASGPTIVTTVTLAAMLSCAYAGLVEGRREFVDEGASVS
jgi:hypothetical protein